MQIMPSESVDYSYVLYPLQAGYCKLPALHVKMANYRAAAATAAATAATATAASLESPQDDMDATVRSMLPSQIFIFPEQVATLSR